MNGLSMRATRGSLVLALIGSSLTAARAQKATSRIDDNQQLRHSDQQGGISRARRPGFSFGFHVAH